MSKVVFLSNVDRRFAMMQVALQQLQQENLLSNDSVCAKLSDNTVWNDEWQKLLEDADILLLKWMGAGLDTPFFKKLLPFIKKHQLRYYIDAAGTEEEELVSGIEKNDLEKLKAEIKILDEKYGHENIKVVKTIEYIVDVTISDNNKQE